MTGTADAVGLTTYTYTSFGKLHTEDGPWDDDTVTLTYGTYSDCGCAQGRHSRTGLSLLQPGGYPWTMSYGYDSADRLQSLTAPSGSFTYSYQAGSLVKKVLMPTGAYITNTFDNVARRTSTILENGANAILNSHAYLYNAGGQRTRQTRTDGSYVDYTYDNIGQLKTAIGKESGGATRPHENFGYAYDPANNLNYRTNNALLQTFNVDTLNQLTSASRSGSLTVAGTVGSPGTNITSVTVADNGNGAVGATLYGDKTFARSGVTLLNGTNTFTAVAQDAYGRSDTNTVAVNLPSAPSYTYDSNGNLTGDGLRTFGYDDENQLTSVTIGNSRTSFTYDGRQRVRVREESVWDSRVGWWVAITATHYIYDGDLVIQERDSYNIPTVTYTRGLDLSGSLDGAGGIGGVLARTDSSLLAGQTGDPHAYYHSDANGNVTMLVNSRQLPVAKYLYDPYGNTISRTGPLADLNVYRFSSKEYHDGIGLYSFGRRFYDPNLQRWLNRDPIGTRAGVNLHAFANNCPTSDIDPNGEFSLVELNFIEAIIGAQASMLLPGLAGSPLPPNVLPFQNPYREPRPGPMGRADSPHYEPGHLHFPHPPEEEFIPIIGRRPYVNPELWALNPPKAITNPPLLMIQPVRMPTNIPPMTSGPSRPSAPPSLIGGPLVPIPDIRRNEPPLKPSP